MIIPVARALCIDHIERNDRVQIFFYAERLDGVVLPITLNLLQILKSFPVV